VGEGRKDGGCKVEGGERKGDFYFVCSLGVPREKGGGICTVSGYNWNRGIGMIRTSL